jgi:hypothetical protein
MRYFLFVGGVLLALLFMVDALAPKSEVVNSASATTSAIDLPVIRIRSDRKWPERVVFDTSAPVIAVAPAAPIEASVPVPVPATVAAMSPIARVRETFAQFVPPEPKKLVKKLPPKNRVAKSRVAPIMVAQHQLLFAQHQRFGFTPNIW